MEVTFYLPNWKNSINNFPILECTMRGLLKNLHETNWTLIFSSWPPPVSAKPKYLKLFVVIVLNSPLATCCWLWLISCFDALINELFCILYVLSFSCLYSYLLFYLRYMCYIFIYYVRFTRKAFFYIFHAQIMFIYILCM